MGGWAVPLDIGVPHLWDISTLNELRRQMLSGNVDDGTKNAHHRLPGSRGGKYPKKKDRHKRGRNLIHINAERHKRWHVLTQNKVATEVAVQFNMWWLREHIFRNYDRQKFECHHYLRETVGRRTSWFYGIEIPADTMDMSARQAAAWAELFGPNTPPEVVCAIINEFLVHPDTPLLLIPMPMSGRT